MHRGCCTATRSPGGVIAVVLSVWKLRVGAEDYYLSQVARGLEDYYSGRGETVGSWTGTGADALGLSGQVDPEDLRALMAGLSPRTGLTANGELLTTSRRRVPGFDLTFSVPKSVSVAYALADPLVRGEMIAGCKQALDSTLEWLEREACHVRRGSNYRPTATGPSAEVGTRRLSGDGFVAARFQHRTSRANDPHLHWHVLVANLSRGPDGRWTALDATGLYRSKRAAGVMFQALMRQELSARLGVIWRPGRKDSGEIAGIPPDVLTLFSKRSAQIEEDLVKRGVHGPAAADESLLTTRRVKQPVPDDTLDAYWRAEAATVGYTPADLDVLLAERHPDPVSERFEIVREDHRTGERSHVTTDFDGWVTNLVHGLVDVAATFTRHELLSHVAAEVGVLVDHPDVERLTARLLAHHLIIPLVPPTTGRAGVAGWEQRYTTTVVTGHEMSIAAGVAAAASDPTARRFAISRNEVDAMVDGSTLGADQADVVRAITSSASMIDVVVGRAGSGKTFTMATVARLYEAHGITVTGVATSGRADRELATGAQIPTSTIAKFLLDPTRQPSDRHVVIVDEAGMVNTRDLDRVVTAARGAGAKMILVGDHHQLPEVGAGGGFAHAVTHAGTAVSELVINRRQREVWEQDALAELRHGDVAAAWKAYTAHDRVVIAGDPAEVRGRAVANWWDEYRTGANAVLLAGTRSETTELNHLARQLAVDAGALTGPTLHVHGRDFQAGDRIVCLKNANHSDLNRSGPNRDAVITNGTVATITAVYGDGQVDIVTSDDRAIRLDAAYVARGWIGHGYALTFHKAQGVTYDYAHIVGPAGLYREAWYVAMSRATRANTMYVTLAEANQLNDITHSTGITPPEDESTPEQLLGQLGRSRANTFVTDTYPDVEAIRQLATGSDLATLEGDLAAVVAIRADYLRAGGPDATELRRRADLSREHRGLLQYGGRVKALDRDNIGFVMRINDSSGEAVVRYTSAAGRSTYKAEAWHNIQPIDQPEPATLSPAAEHHLRTLDDWADHAALGWAMHLAAHGYRPEAQRQSQAAIRIRADQLAARLTADPPDWLTQWFGQRPLRGATCEVWDTQISGVAAWRDRHHVRDDVSGFGQMPADPLTAADWESHVRNAVEARVWLDTNAAVSAAPKATISATDWHDRMQQLEQLIASAPADQRPWTQQLLTDDTITPAGIHVRLQQATALQTERQEWILTNWASIVEHAELVRIGAPSLPAPATNLRLAAMIEEALVLLGSVTPETRTLEELESAIAERDPRRQAQRIGTRRDEAYVELNQIRLQLTQTPDGVGQAELNLRHKTLAGTIRELSREYDRAMTRAAINNIGGDPVTAELKVAIANRTRRMVSEALHSRPKWLDDCTASNPGNLLDEVAIHLCGAEAVRVGHLQHVHRH